MFFFARLFAGVGMARPAVSHWIDLPAAVGELLVRFPHQCSDRLTWADLLYVRMFMHCGGRG